MQQGTKTRPSCGTGGFMRNSSSSRRNVRVRARVFRRTWGRPTIPTGSVHSTHPGASPWVRAAWRQGSMWGRGDFRWYWSASSRFVTSAVRCGLHVFWPVQAGGSLGSRRLTCRARRGRFCGWPHAVALRSSTVPSGGDGVGSRRAS